MDTVEDVITRLAAIDAALPPGDGLAVFNAVYLRVTETVRDRLREGIFDDPGFVERLDVVFADLYFAAVEAADSGAEAPRAWDPVVEARGNRGIEPVQFVLAGMNAHINHDLALAVVTACRRADRDPSTVHGDFERFNEVLASLVRPIRQSFLDSVVVELGLPFSPLADLVSNWSIETAREAAWVHARTLWELSPGPLAEVYAATLARTVGLVSRQLLTDFGPT